MITTCLRTNLSTGVVGNELLDDQKQTDKTLVSVVEKSRHGFQYVSNVTAKAGPRRTGEPAVELIASRRENADAIDRVYGDMWSYNDSKPNGMCIQQGCHA